MATKKKDNVDSELRSTPFQPQADETSKRQAPSHEEIRKRAYEIYLERDGRPGNEIDRLAQGRTRTRKGQSFRTRLGSHSTAGCPDSESAN
jgi:hypothetical protein